MTALDGVEAQQWGSSGNAGGGGGGWWSFPPLAAHPRDWLRVRTVGVVAAM
jgi:hypothetical protein